MTRALRQRNLFFFFLSLMPRIYGRQRISLCEYGNQHFKPSFYDLGLNNSNESKSKFV